MNPLRMSAEIPLPSASPFEKEGDFARQFGLLLFFPDELGIKRGIPWIQDSRRPLLVFSNEITQLFGGDILAFVLMADGLDCRRWGVPLSRHPFSIPLA